MGMKFQLKMESYLEKEAGRGIKGGMHSQDRKQRDVEDVEKKERTIRKKIKFQLFLYKYEFMQ